MNTTKKVTMSWTQGSYKTWGEYLEEEAETAYTLLLALASVWMPTLIYSTKNCHIFCIDECITVSQFSLTFNIYIVLPFKQTCYSVNILLHQTSRYSFFVF